MNVGCIPTKTLVASARAIHVARRGAEFGFTTGGDVRVDMSRVKARKDAIVRQSNEGVERWMKSTPNLTAYDGHGRFTGPHTVVVNGDVLQGQQIFINVGTRAVVPDMPGVGDVPFLTSTTALELERLPASLLVIGGGYIGCELAQMFARAGVAVTIVCRRRLLPETEPEISDALTGYFRDEGITVYDGITYTQMPAPMAMS